VIFLSLWFITTLSAADPRVVAVGDIHGDFDAFVGILQRAKLIDSKHRWSGGNAILVQTGDFLDRGPKGRAVMDLLMALQNESRRQGGRVLVLMGNHEAMNIYGDLRYVSDADYASFADGKRDGRRQRCEAFEPGGKYGKWLRTLPAVARVHDSIFLHGGISPELASWKIEKINDTIEAEIKAFDSYKKYLLQAKIAQPCSSLDELTAAARKAAELSKTPEEAETLKGFLSYGGWLSVHPDGPLWFRGYAQWSDAEGAAHMNRLTEAFDVRRFVVGHTIQGGQIRPRFGGKLYLIDTAMLSGLVPGGRPSALNIQDGMIDPIY
jgi:hypothetical protein